MVDYQSQISQAYQLYKQGRQEQALFTLRKIVQQSSTETMAWWGIALVSADPVEKRRAAERVLMLKPDHRGAPKLLNRLDEQPHKAAKQPRQVRASGPEPSGASAQTLGAPWLWFILLLLGFILVATIAIGAMLFIFILSGQPT